MANYDKRPLQIEAKGNGSYFYRWDITENKKQSECGVTTSYDCKEVTIWNPVTKEAIKRTVINHLWGDNYEQKLINEYNSAKLGILTSADAEDNYKKFLEARIAIKEHIDEDCLMFNVK